MREARLPPEYYKKRNMMLKIPTKALILVAAIVWFIAGAFVISVGVTAALEPWSFVMGLAFLIVFVAFLVLFLMIARKHIRRIRSYTEPLTEIYKFFDTQSYIIIAVMVFLGAALRVSLLVPEPAIASFYSGLGLALLASSIYYIVTYVAVCDELVIKDRGTAA